MLGKRSFHPCLEALEDRCVPSTFTVINRNDAGIGSLRQTVFNANANNGADTIVFKRGLEGTIRLTGGEIVITDHLTILGPGAAKLAVSGNFSSRIFYIDNGGTDLNVKVQSLEMRHGNGNGNYGGAIFCLANLTLTKVVCTQNQAFGGGAVAAVDLTVNTCKFTGNRATGDSGGAIRCTGGTITGSTITGNTTVGNGGGVFSFGLVTITSSTLSGNAAGTDGEGNGGAVWGASAVDLTRSTVVGNTAISGAGVLCLTATITGSTFAHNRGSYGAGLFLEVGGGTSEVRNCTFSGNRVTVDGGAIYTRSTNLNVRNSTISFNYAGQNGGGLYAETVARLESCLIADNDAAGVGKNLANEMHYLLDHCLISLYDGATIQDFSGNPISPANPGNNLFNVDPLLAPLASNGGPTQTHALKKGSPAINHGSNSTGLRTDQRGPGFKRRVGGKVDIGAFERQ